MLGNNEHPWSTYEYLTRNSQIPRTERLRSDSASTPDCIWGFPSYAVREALAAKGLKDKLAPAVERPRPSRSSPTTTPRGPGRRSTSWSGGRPCRLLRLSREGLVRMVRKRPSGGYFTILTPPEGTAATQRVAYRSRWVHIAVGYPGLKFLDDLQAYRDTYQDYASVVNAYEPHEGVYEELTTARHGRDPRQRHRRVPDPAAADRRPRPHGRADPDRPRLPHLRRRAPTARASSCAGVAATAGPTRASTTPSRCGAAS